MTAIAEVSSPRSGRTVSAAISHAAMRLAVGASESGAVPDPLLRMAIRRLCAVRLRDERRRAAADGHRDILQGLRHGPIALDVDAANAQHYELPPAYFDVVLGARRK